MLIFHTLSEKIGRKALEITLFHQDDLENLLKLSDEPKLVTLMYINNEIGNILDINSVSDLCQKYNSLFHTDAVQGIGHFHFDLEQLPVDFLSSAAHKFHGPKGIGFSFVRKNFGLDPFIYGGAQERSPGYARQ